MSPWGAPKRPRLLELPTDNRIVSRYGVEAAGIEPAPGGAKLPAESRPYLATARNAWESISRRVPSCPVPFQPIPHAPATYVQHRGSRRSPYGPFALSPGKVPFSRVTMRGPVDSHSLSVQGHPRPCPALAGAPRAPQASLDALHHVPVPLSDVGALHMPRRQALTWERSTSPAITLQATRPL